MTSGKEPYRVCSECKTAFEILADEFANALQEAEKPVKEELRKITGKRP